MATELKTTFPKSSSGVSARAAIRQWQKAQPAPRAVRVADQRVKAVRLTRAALDELRALVENDDASTREVPARGGRSGRDLDTKKLFGTLNSAFTTYEYMLMQAEYRRRKATGFLTSVLVERQWRSVVQAAQTAFAAAGLRGVTENDLSRFVRELTANGANLGAVAKLRASAVGLSAAGLTAATPMVASLIPTVGAIAEAVPGASVIAGLCSQPITQGSFTKHLSNSVTLSVKITYWCPSWSNPFKTCTKRVTLASVSFSVGINVGYKVTCCGATAWGQGYVQACAQVLFLRACAGCTGTITGVAGVSRTPVASGCNYGLGIKAKLRCVLAGIPILDVAYSFGWVITAPCPPAGLCA